MRPRDPAPPRDPTARGPAGARAAWHRLQILAPALLAACFGCASHASPDEPPGSQASTQPAPRGERPGAPLARLVFKDRVTPHWFDGDQRFWYRNDLRGGAKEFVVVDAERGTRAPAFDHRRLAAALSAAGLECRHDRLPFDTIQFTEDRTAVRFAAGGDAWECRLGSYVCAKTATAGDEQPATASAPQSAAGPAPGRTGRRGPPRSAPPGDAPGGPARSPDGRWTALVKDHDVFLKSADGAEVRLSEDGEEGLAYGRLAWSPDSRALVAFRIAPGERKEVHLVQSSPRGGGRAQLQSRPYALPGDRFTTCELNVFDVDARKQMKPAVDRFEHERAMPRLHWKKDGHRVTYQQVDRGHQRLRVIEVDALTGAARNLIDEKTDTFLWTAHAENVGLSPVHWLEKTDELIHACESSGWRHLYLVDGEAGRVKNAITKGEWVVRGVDRIDEAGRQVWFHASGVHPGQDPYFVHYGRVGFDGNGLVFLTAGNGNHSVQHSPSGSYLIDTYSRVDQPPVTELRRVQDGQLVCRLEEADTSALREKGWTPPEVFVAKGRDGVTDIWGILCRPRDFDPGRKYPVLEDIYAGPQGSFVPKTFSANSRYESWTRLGFFVVKIDGMGTANRSKAFHDVCWQNLADAGFPDRILWIQAAAAKHPQMDLTRVGIYGTSAGGQSAAGALLFHPEFYKAAVANCGCHDNRMDKASWNEQWMGYPVGPQYARSSNIDNASKLQGRLFLIVGELDENVPPESTLRFADALIKADKDFDLLVVPGGRHGAGGSYVQRRMQDFFVRHLLGVEPPDRNAARPEGGGDGGR
jgi:dipeptidyl aminopeptidase/acylaminoacyl peptidase